MQLLIQIPGQAGRSERLSRLVSTVGFGSGCDIVLGPAERALRLGIFIKQGDGCNFKPLVMNGELIYDGRPLTGMVALEEGKELAFRDVRLVFQNLKKEIPTQGFPASPRPPTPAGSFDSLDDDPPVAPLGRKRALQAYSGAGTEPSPPPTAKPLAPASPSKTKAVSEISPKIPARSDAKAEIKPESRVGTSPDTGSANQQDLVRLHALLLRRLDKAGAESTLDTLVLELDSLIAEVTPHLDPAKTRKRILDWMEGWGPLNPLILEPAHLQIAIPAWDRVLVRRLDRGASSGPCFYDQRHLLATVRMLEKRCRLIRQDTQGWEGQLDTWSVCVWTSGPSLSPQILIRRTSTLPSSLRGWVDSNRMSGEMADLLELAMLQNLNLFICGPQGSGKTGLMQALLETADPGETLLQWGEPVPTWPSDGRPFFAANPAAGSDYLDDMARRLHSDRLLIDPLDSSNMVPCLRALRRGQRGCLAGLTARDLSSALRWLPALVPTSESYEHQHAAQMFGEFFHLAVELIPLGASSAVGQILEFDAANADNPRKNTRVIFECRREPAGLSFLRSGTIPRFIENLRQLDKTSPNFDRFREIEA